MVNSKKRWGYILLPLLLGTSLFIILAMSLPVSATTYTFTPDADAFVREDRATTNYGSSTILRTRVASGKDVDSYLRFPIVGLSGSVTTATLRLYVQDSDSNGFEVRKVVSETGWTEGGITYNSSPTVGDLVTVTSAVSASSWHEIDVTSYITGDGAFDPVP